MFFKKWFKSREKLPKDDLIKWLKTISKSVTYADKSAYFKIDGITIRYSDHLATSSDGTFHIIKLEHEYLAFTNTFKFPKAFTDVERLKIFIEDFIFIYKSFHKELIPPLEEIIEEKLQYIKPTPVQEIIESSTELTNVDEIVDKAEEAYFLRQIKKLDLDSNIFPNAFKTDEIIKLFGNYAANLRPGIITFANKHPDKLKEILMFMETYRSKPKSKKKKAWSLFVNQNEHRTN